MRLPLKLPSGWRIRLAPPAELAPLPAVRAQAAALPAREPLTPPAARPPIHRAEPSTATATTRVRTRALIGAIAQAGAAGVDAPALLARLLRSPEWAALLSEDQSEVDELCGRRAAHLGWLSTFRPEELRALSVALGAQNLGQAGALAELAEIELRLGARPADGPFDRPGFCQWARRGFLALIDSGLAASAALRLIAELGQGFTADGVPSELGRATIAALAKEPPARLRALERALLPVLGPGAPVVAPVSSALIEQGLAGVAPRLGRYHGPLARQLASRLLEEGMEPARVDAIVGLLVDDGAHVLLGAAQSWFSSAYGAAGRMEEQHQPFLDRLRTLSADERAALLRSVPPGDTWVRDLLELANTTAQLDRTSDRRVSIEGAALLLAEGAAASDVARLLPSFQRIAARDLAGVRGPTGQELAELRPALTLMSTKALEAWAERSVRYAEGARSIIELCLLARHLDLDPMVSANERLRQRFPSPELRRMAIELAREGLSREALEGLRLLALARPAGARPSRAEQEELAACCAQVSTAALGRASRALPAGSFARALLEQAQLSRALLGAPGAAPCLELSADPKVRTAALRLLEAGYEPSEVAGNLALLFGAASGERPSLWSIPIEGRPSEALHAKLRSVAAPMGLDFLTHLRRSLAQLAGDDPRAMAMKGWLLLLAMELGSRATTPPPPIAEGLIARAQWAQGSTG